MIFVVLFQLLLILRATSAVRIRMRASVLYSTVSLWVILTLSGPGASSTTAFIGYVIQIYTLLGILIQFSSVQYIRSATNSTFRNIIMFSSCWNCQKSVNWTICLLLWLYVTRLWQSQSNLNIAFVKVQFMAGLLYWIALDFTGVSTYIYFCNCKWGAVFFLWDAVTSRSVSFCGIQNCIFTDIVVI